MLVFAKGCSLLFTFQRSIWLSLFISCSTLDQYTQEIVYNLFVDINSSNYAFSPLVFYFTCSSTLDYFAFSYNRENHQ